MGVWGPRRGGAAPAMGRRMGGTTESTCGGSTGGACAAAAPRVRAGNAGRGGTAHLQVQHSTLFGAGTHERTGATSMYEEELSDGVFGVRVRVGAGACIVFCVLVRMRRCVLRMRRYSLRVPKMCDCPTCVHSTPPDVRRHAM